MANKKETPLTKRLINLREQHDWSKTEVARRLGLPNMQRYANYEYGFTEPDNEMLQKIAETFGVTTDYLLGKNSTPKWANEKDTNDLAEFLKDNAGSMTYQGENLTQEEKEKLEIAMTQIFWKRHKHD